MKIGIVRETRRWDDRRVAITPETAGMIQKNYPHVELVVQSSQVRAYPDGDYQKLGIPIVEDVSDCDVLIGVKEVAEEGLIEEKTYVMFAHVAKMQTHNQQFFQYMAKKKITLLDYEYFTRENQSRVVAFGFWAGVVGTYYAFVAVAKRFCQLDLPAPQDCRDLSDLHQKLKQMDVPPIKIVVTGGGRVAAGAMEIIHHLGIAEVLPRDFLEEEYDHPVFTRLDPADYVRRGAGQFNFDHFIKNPQEYESIFHPYTKVADVFIPCHFWDKNSPVFFTAEDLKVKDFSISIIADVSCDIPGPIPTTIRSSTLDEPFYDVDPETLEEQQPFSSPGHVTVMAVDNLPTALPVDASRTFALDMYNEVFPSLFGNDKDGVIERATILKDGKLTARFNYLKDFLGQ